MTLVVKLTITPKAATSTVLKIMLKFFILYEFVFKFVVLIMYFIRLASIGIKMDIFEKKIR